MKLSKKFSVKIPKDIKIIYYTEQNFIVLIGPLGRKILKLKLKLFLTTKRNYIYVTKIQSENLTDNRKKTLRALCGTTVASLKQIILEISVILYKKIRFIGVGYKVFPVMKYEGHLFQLKLGFSHSIYYKTPNTVRVTPFKHIYIYIFGTSYYFVTQAAATIRSYKFPEPYKGKGILYENEKIKLKEGKKV
jgi:large subunit ribosomal protein L6